MEFFSDLLSRFLFFFFLFFFSWNVMSLSRQILKIVKDEPIKKYRGEDYPYFQKSLSGDRCEDFTCQESEEELVIDLQRRSKEVEESFMLLSKELEQGSFLQNSDFDVPSLIQMIWTLAEERVSLALEVSSCLHSWIAERAFLKEKIRFAKTELESQTRRVEKEKNELQSALERELDRRSSDWSSKLEKSQSEVQRLQERARELAQHNVALQREVSSFHERDAESKRKITCFEQQLKDTSKRVEDMNEENQELKRNLSELQENCRAAEEDHVSLQKNFETKEKECKELHKTVTILLRTYTDENKTIDGLREEAFAEESGKTQPMPEMDKKDESLNRLQTDLPESSKELIDLRLRLPKIAEERDLMWEMVKIYEEMTMVLDNEVALLKKKLHDVENLATKHHVGSSSSPSRSHPSTARVEEQLNMLRAMEGTLVASSTSSDSLSVGLSGLGVLYECVDDLLNMASTQQVLSQNQNEKCVDELLEGSVELLDVCGISRDILMQIKDHVRALQSAVRRRKGLENSITSYTCFRKKMKKDIKKLITSTLKPLEKKFKASILVEQENDHFYAVVRVLRQVCQMNISIFQSLLVFLTFPKSKSKPKSNLRRWSFVAKLMHKAVISCGDSHLGVNEFDSVDTCLATTVVGDAEKIRTAQQRLEALENCIQGLESDLESVYGRLIGTRTSLLNMISQNNPLKILY